MTTNDIRWVYDWIYSTFTSNYSDRGGGVFHLEASGGAVCASQTRFYRCPNVCFWGTGYLAKLCGYMEYAMEIGCGIFSGLTKMGEINPIRAAADYCRFIGELFYAGVV